VSSREGSGKVPEMNTVVSHSWARVSSSTRPRICLLRVGLVVLPGVGRLTPDQLAYPGSRTSRATPLVSRAWNRDREMDV
jgi:hypothetical protein